MNRTLTSNDRTFFSLVSEAAFANPFSDAREQVDIVIANASGPRERVLEEMITKLWKKLSSLGPVELNAWEAADRVLLETAVLFSVFHKYSPQMDEHIRRQNAASSLLKAPFGKEILHELRSYQVPEDRVLRIVGMFYQIRRAFFFIADSLTGQSDSIQRVREQLWNNVFTHDMGRYESQLWDRMEDFSTFIVGATGTGKGSAAAAIGRSGWIPYSVESQKFEWNFTEAFVSTNLSEFAETLIESELFGHRKGAFTGAIDAHQGVFQRCQSHGTIFLDEIGELSEQIQLKLLRVIQERVYSPVGSYQEERFDGRVVAATNQSVDKLRLEGKFRDDFYYRLCSDVIEMPTLQTRIEEDPGELAILVDGIVERVLGEKDEEVTKLVLESTSESLPKDYAWPGNVRELEQCVRRLLLTKSYEGDTLRRPNVNQADHLSQAIDAEDFDASGLISEYCRILYARHGTYEEVARRTNLDRRTVKKYLSR